MTRNLKMSEEQSVKENGLVTTEECRFDDETAEPEVILCLPRGSDPALELVLRATPMDLGAVSADADTPDPGQHRRFGPLSGAKPKCSMYEMPTLPTPGHSRPPLSTRTQQVTNQFMYEMPTLQTPGHGRPPLRTGTQPVTDRFMYEQPTLPTLVHSHSRLPPRTGTQPVCDFYIPAQADLVDNVEQSKVFTVRPVDVSHPGSAGSTQTGGVYGTKSHADRLGQGTD